MEELRQILTDHAGKYPLMEPTDAVKLIYQNEFGAGHMIKDETTCMTYLFREYECVTKQESAEIFEDIGNGLVRVHLSALKNNQLESLGRVFIHGAAQHRGTLERFIRKLEVLKALTAEGYFSFHSEQLQLYLKAYMDAGYPAVSHSEAYRRQYRPAYRVIRHCDMITEILGIIG